MGKMNPPARDRVHFCIFCNHSRARRRFLTSRQKSFCGSSSVHFSKRTFSLEMCCKNRACSFQSGFLVTLVVQSVLFSLGKTHGFRPHLYFTILSRTFTSGAESPSARSERAWHSIGLDCLGDRLGGRLGDRLGDRPPSRSPSQSNPIEGQARSERAEGDSAPEVKVRESIVK